MAKWKKSDGSATELKHMATTHLFYTLRLVWNSMMPRPLSVGTYKSVLFRVDIYTVKYWQDILPLMFDELHSRDNLPNRYVEQLANIQLDALLERTSTQEKLDEAVKFFLMREDTDGLPETSKYAETWDDEKGVQV